VSAWCDGAAGARIATKQPSADAQHIFHQEPEMSHAFPTSDGARVPVRAYQRTVRDRSCVLSIVLCLAAPAMAQTTTATPRDVRGASTHVPGTTTTAPTPVPPHPGAKADDSIRPFRARVSDEALSDLRRRIRATRWPDRETVPDGSQGVQLHKLQALVQYWGSGYDWRKAEARLNALPQYTTTIDGLDIHFIHVRSRHPNALPLVISHGWPGSIFEQIALIGPLTDPTAHGGSAADAFDVVIPSLPGYGFSAQPTEPGWGPERIGRAWDVLMKRLGYTRYVSQGGDWGSVIAQAMGRQAPAGLLGIHVNLPAAVPPEVERALGAGAPPPAELSPPEREVFAALAAYRMAGSAAYNTMLTARPQALGYGMADSPAGLAAFQLVHPGYAQWLDGRDRRQVPARDEVLDNLSLYWLTNSVASSARIYWENGGRAVTSAAAQRTAEIRVPVAVTVFPQEVYRAPETWVRRAFPTLRYFHEADRGGHFAAWEYPELFAAELRAAFRSLR
jgi:pimeloyl-ACP methyl ester carboxylesterase